MADEIDYGSDAETSDIFHSILRDEPDEIRAALLNADVDHQNASANLKRKRGGAEDASQLTPRSRVVADVGADSHPVSVDHETSGTAHEDAHDHHDDSNRNSHSARSSEC